MSLGQVHDALQREPFFAGSGAFDDKLAGIGEGPPPVAGGGVGGDAGEVVGEVRPGVLKVAYEIAAPGEGSDVDMKVAEVGAADSGGDFGPD